MSLGIVPSAQCGFLKVRRRTKVDEEPCTNLFSSVKVLRTV